MFSSIYWIDINLLKAAQILIPVDKYGMVKPHSLFRESLSLVLLIELHTPISSENIFLQIHFGFLTTIGTRHVFLECFFPFDSAHRPSLPQSFVFRS